MSQINDNCLPFDLGITLGFAMKECSVDYSTPMWRCKRFKTCVKSCVLPTDSRCYLHVDATGLERIDVFGEGTQCLASVDGVFWASLSFQLWLCSGFLAAADSSILRGSVGLVQNPECSRAPASLPLLSSCNFCCLWSSSQWLQTP